MNGPLEWIAAIGTIIAAALVASDLGRRVTGWGFVLFCVVAIVWVISSLLNNTIPLAVQNAILLAVNAWGVWQYLLSPKKKREIERAEELAEQAKDDVEAEKG
jgi:4-amino-4-deoxy-L-arabinose transferase-like glycosyltransferase